MRSDRTLAAGAGPARWQKSQESKRFHPCVKFQQIPTLRYKHWSLSVSLLLGTRCLSNGCLSTGTQNEWFVCKSFKNGASVSSGPPALLNVSPPGFQSHIEVAHFPAQVPWSGEPNLGLNPLLFNECPWLWYTSCLWAAAPGIWILAKPHPCPYLFWGSLFFMSFVVENMFC